jgi:hypothetical protein
MCGFQFFNDSRWADEVNIFLEDILGKLERCPPSAVNFLSRISGPAAREFFSTVAWSLGQGQDVIPQGVWQVCYTANPRIR